MFQLSGFYCRWSGPKDIHGAGSTVLRLSLIIARFMTLILIIFTTTTTTTTTTATTATTTPAAAAATTTTTNTN